MMADAVTQMQQMSDRFAVLLNDEAVLPGVALAVMKQLHDGLLPRISESQRSLYDVLIRECQVTILPKEDDDGDAH